MGSDRDWMGRIVGPPGPPPVPPPDRYDEMNEHRFIWFWVKRVGGCVLLLGVSLLGGCPVYNVWSAKMEGEAIHAKAEAARKVLVSQAQAEKEAASQRAAAIEIVGKAAKDFPEYRQQEFIGAFAHAMEAGKINQIIYVPTEANIPVMEATRNHAK